MLNESLAERYAVALFSLAKEAGQAFKQMEELRLVSSCLEKSRDLSAVLRSPAVPRATKKSIIAELFRERVSERTLHFLYLVVDKGRERHLEDIIRCFEVRLKSDMGIVEARVEVAEALDPQIEALVLTRLVRLTGKKVEMKVIVRPELVAGVVITLGDRLYDGSIKGHLDKIRELMSKG